MKNITEQSNLVLLAEVLWKAILKPLSPEDISAGVESLQEISRERGFYWPPVPCTSLRDRANSEHQLA